MYGDGGKGGDDYDDDDDTRSVQSQPVTSTIPTSARDEFIRKEVEKVANEWGFSDHQVAQAMLNRKQRFNRAKSKRMKEKRLEDPDYKYQLLMKRVKANRTSSSSRMDSHSVSGGSSRKVRRTRGSKPMGNPVKSQVGKDRLNMRRKNKRRMPAWKPKLDIPPANTKMHLNNWTNNDNNDDDDRKSHSKMMFPPLK